MHGKSTGTYAHNAASCIGLVIMLAVSASAQAKRCTAKEADAASAVVDQLDTWAKVERAFKKYRHCDDGSIAEGFSEAVARLLVDRWNTLPVLAQLAKTDPGLSRFVVRHIDTTLNTDDLEKIRDLSSRSCPAGSAALCTALHRATERAIRE